MKIFGPPKRYEAAQSLLSLEWGRSISLPHFSKLARPHFQRLPPLIRWRQRPVHLALRSYPTAITYVRKRGRLNNFLFPILCLPGPHGTLAPTEIQSYQVRYYLNYRLKHIRQQYLLLYRDSLEPRLAEVRRYLKSLEFI
jgi:hypothetical protein